LRDACEGKQVLDARGFGVRFVDNYDLAIAKSQDTATINESDRVYFNGIKFMDWCHYIKKWRIQMSILLVYFNEVLPEIM
jgi:hypothetical protein